VGGHAIRVAEGNGWRCLLYDDESDSCQRPELIAQGLCPDVTNDCGEAGTHGMTIAGVVPPGVAEVVVGYSDDSTQIASVNEGAFAMSGTTPARGDPSPVRVQWLGANGENLGAPLPDQPGRLLPELSTSMASSPVVGTSPDHRARDPRR
jgi:hypothetical protein